MFFLQFCSAPTFCEPLQADFNLTGNSFTHDHVQTKNVQPKDKTCGTDSPKIKKWPKLDFLLENWISVAF
jgi:hypothetical protein